MNLPDEWTTGTVSTNDIEIQYYRTGNGPPIVMAHGMFDNGRRWIPLAADLADDHEVITYDARGHGRSDAPETGYDIDTRVADLVGLITGLNLTDPILLGHSMGGATVAWTAANHPDLPCGLVLVDPSRFLWTPDIDPEDAGEIARERLDEAKSNSIEHRIKEHYSDSSLGRDHAERLAAAVDECSPHIAKLAQEHPAVREAFHDITSPTLVLRRDVDAEDRMEDEAVADLVDGRITHVTDAGHYVFRDAYDTAYDELRQFLRRL